MAIAIRPIEETDLPRCAAVFAQAFAALPYEDQWDPVRAERKLTKLWRAEPTCCLCAEVSGLVVGAIFCRLDSWWKGDCLVVHEFFVHPNHQRRGLGHALIEAVQTQARQQGVKGVWLIANRHAAAFKFYQQHDFYEPSHVAVMLKDFREER